jgi:hypothetical protein
MTTIHTHTTLTHTIDRAANPALRQTVHPAKAGFATGVRDYFQFFYPLYSIVQPIYRRIVMNNCARYLLLSSTALLMSISASSGILVTNCDDSGPGSLREAITTADSHAGPDTILFAIPKGVPGHDASDGVWRIFPQSQLPVITDDELTIDGFSQAKFIGEDSNPHGPDILINGSNAGQYVSGFVVRASAVNIMGLTINNFYSQGIWFDYADGCNIRGCYIGTDFTGFDPVPNGYGIWIGNKSQYIVITALDTFRNVISGNTNGGIAISDTSHHVQIIGNIIGLNCKANAPLGNGNYGGVCIQRQCDSVAVFDNWIGGNRFGIYILESSRNTIQMNWIGTVPEHLFPGTGNEHDGIFIADKSYDNRILDNHIWFNKAAGVRIYGEQPYRNRISHNSIAHNEQSGILYDSGGANVIAQPVVTGVTGTSVTGTAISDASIEIYTDSENEGEIFQGEITSNPSGDFRWDGTIVGPFSNVTAIAIDAQGNTSFFSSPLNTHVDLMKDHRVPGAFSLKQNYPNPFNPNTAIRYRLATSSHVDIGIYNLLGQKVAALVSETQPAGHYTVVWDASHFTAGVYFCRMEANEHVKRIKLALVK